ncbi:hypothetical protein DRE_01500 [Drechslerella stenobrocha 248]|uniref:glucan 1,3-beta-glucosidase n=1 Tax=Drechslerella stenobrocha 248 TaxID=1043628 RepID=W7HUU5_9PEZI|nr:hypothetical protein DRE_01500 [Drechslerella stenobrocha 248]
MKAAAIIVSSLLAACASATPAVQLRSINFDFAHQKVRGVNAGGWLVLEPWITPSLWRDWDRNPAAGPVDEWHLCRVLGKSRCASRLKKHWETWFTERDFRDMKTVGLNTVRIPIGYWAFQLNPGDPYVQGQVEYLDRAIEWARRAGLMVWIDLHGAPGSQNGFDNSGLRDTIAWQTGRNVITTLEVIRKIARKYAQPKYRDVVAVIELLNEPLGPRLDTNALRQFHKDGFGKVREVSDTFIAFSDGFLPPSWWNGVLSQPHGNVIVDHHHYQVFSEEMVARDYPTQIAAACNARTDTAGADKYVVVGEWSGAMTDCARWLNGYGRGSRYEGTFQSSRRHGDCKTKGNLKLMSYSQRQDLRKYLEAQMDSFEQANGWIFWTWKAEEGNNNDDWSYSKLVSRSVFPRPAWDRRYKDVCHR